MLLLTLGMTAACQGAEVSGRIVKVLPFLLDQQGQNAISPSLFDRDAYQAHLRDHTNEVSGLRFDVQWKATKAPGEKLALLLQMRSIGTNNLPQVKTIEVALPPGRQHQWTEIPLTGPEYQSLGHLVAWRVTLWNDEQELDGQSSFLW